MNTYIHKRAINKNKGFSLAEILLSLVIVSVGTIGIGKLYASMISGNVDSKNRFQAATFAEAKLESLRFSNKVGDTVSSGTEDVTKENNTYRITWTTEDLGKGQTSLTTTVQWLDRNGEYSDDTTITLSSISAAAKLAPLSPPAPPVFDTPAFKCGPGGSSDGAYGSTVTSPTSCGSGNIDTGSS